MSSSLVSDDFLRDFKNNLLNLLPEAKPENGDKILIDLNLGQIILGFLFLRHILMLLTHFDYFSYKSF